MRLPLPKEAYPQTPTHSCIYEACEVDERTNLSEIVHGDAPRYSSRVEKYWNPAPSVRFLEKYHSENHTKSKQTFKGIICLLAQFTNFAIAGTTTTRLSVI